MISIEWLFAGQIVTGVFVIILLRKMTKMKKNMDVIIKEVKEYVTFIIEEEEESQPKEQITYKSQEGVKNSKQNQTGKEVAKDEAQTRLIQAVLGEYFP